MIKIPCTVQTQAQQPVDWQKFAYESGVVPRVGELLVRHVDGESSSKNRFRVVEVIHVVETRQWYVDHILRSDVHLILEPFER